MAAAPFGAHEEDDYFEGMGEDFAFQNATDDPEQPGRRGMGPTQVFFSVYVDPPPKNGEVVVLQGSLPELTNEIRLRACDSGERRLWKGNVVLNTPPGGGALGPMGPGPAMGQGMLRGLFGGGLDAPQAQQQPLFEVNYSVRSGSGAVLRQEGVPQQEFGQLRQYYYHQAKFTGERGGNIDQVFPYFVHEEILQLQTNYSTREFVARFQQLSQCAFARKRVLLDRALENLIQVHWGANVRPPAKLIIGITAALGFFRRQQQNQSWADGGLPFGLGGTPLGDKDKDKDPPLSLIVCRWIIRHSPTPQDLEEEERREAQAAQDGRDNQRRAGEIGRFQVQRFLHLGYLLAAETLYVGEKSYEWLKLLSILPEHMLPAPLNASTCKSDEREALQRSFTQALQNVFADFQERQRGLKSAFSGDPKDRTRQEQAVQQFIELYLRGLTGFCPSVDGLHKLLQRVAQDTPGLSEVAMSMVFSRLRSLHFGPQDKKSLTTMLSDLPAMHSDECAIALLSNSHHPSDSFSAQEIIQFVRMVTESREGVRPAGNHLQSTMRRWLVRQYGRQPDRSGAGKDDRQNAKSSKADYKAQKEEIREAIRNAIRGWHMVLAIPCFKQEEESMRLLLFEFSQAYFFKDPDSLLVLDSLLDLESEFRTISVRHLEIELQRIAIKAMRDAHDVSEVVDAEDLLRLLFERPTHLRFVLIEAFISFRQAAADLGQLLKNEPIWSKLLTPAWRNDRDIREHQLGQILQTGAQMLISSAQQLGKGTIHLSQLHVILQHKETYEALILSQAPQVSKDTPKNIPPSAKILHKFDTEFRDLRTYAKLFCASGHIDAQSLERTIDHIQENYAHLELNSAEKRFEGLAVRPHLPWLYSLRGSDVFVHVWKVACGQDGPDEKRPTQKLSQEYVVSDVIPKAKSSWEKLAKSVETGKAVLKSIRWCVDMEWVAVQRELQLLEATAPKSGPWLQEASRLAKAMRLGAQLREWAPSILHLRHVLSELFAQKQGDDLVVKLRQVVRLYEHMWEMPFGNTEKQVQPFAEIINTLSKPMQDYVITAAKHDASLTYLLKQPSLEDFNRLISLCRPNTDDSVVLAALAALQQTRTFLAETLYSKPPYANLNAFIHQLSTLPVDDTVHASMQSIQTHFEPVLNLLTTHSRTPGVQACYDLKKIYEAGTFSVKCSPKENDQITCKYADGSRLSYEALSELRRQLLMTDVPAELEGATNLPEMLQDLVEKFALLEEYGRCAMQLLTLGHFAYRAGDEVLSVKPKEPVSKVQQKLTELLANLADWQKAVDAARSTHYFLNYFTVREICFLVTNVPKIGNDEIWQTVWPLLRVVNPQGDSKQVKKQMQSSQHTSALNKATNEVDRLNLMGLILEDLFGPVPPIQRKLDGVKAAKQQLQGDLLIRSMQSTEQGIPVFVCCAEEASKVTELVLSMYARRERVPEAEELLLCSSNTSVEEVELLLRRFFSARSQKRDERLYCLGNVHLLPYIVQCGTVEALRRFEDKFGYDSASALVFVSGAPNQMLTNALNQHNLAVSILPRENLRDAVKRVGEKYHGRNFEAVAGHMNGAGKTHYILREVCKLQKEYNGKAILHHVEIRETTGIAALVTALLSDPTDPGTATAVHIDLAHILPSHVDTLLFEVLIVGMLRNPANCNVYHRRPQDFFYIEIPNTPQENTALHLSFCLLLPRQFLTMEADRLDKEMPVLQADKATKGKANLVKFEKNAQLAIVGQILSAMRVEAFNPKSGRFKADWNADKEPEVPTATIYQLLHEVCCSETSPPSFLVFMNFVKFLGELVTMAEGWNMMNLQLLQNFDPGLKHFKHCFYRLLIETSRDFALRQVPKGSVPAVSPLGLVQPQNTRGDNGGPQPDLARATSSNSQVQQQVSRVISGNDVRRTSESRGAADGETESGGLGRIDAAVYVKRFDAMPSWENCVHPIANFKKNEQGLIIGCNIISLQKEFLSNFIDRNLQNSLNLNDLKLEKDWSKVTHQEAVSLVYQVEGGALLKKLNGAQEGPKEYVVTVDNLLKLLSIQQRLKFGLPVVLMGETGCGKTALVNFLAKSLEFRLCTLDIHGGITDEVIMKFMDDSIAKADEARGALVFFDEINAANCMSLFKSIIIDRMYGNTVVPPNVRIISCCNPYRVRRNEELEQVALVFQHTTDATSGIQDPMRRLVYRVHPLPESLVDIVNDFGSLSEKSEDLYIMAILKKELPRWSKKAADESDAEAEGRTDYETFMSAFKDLLCASQVFVREVNSGERSVVSMRDIARAARVFKWFLTYYSKLRGTTSPVVSDDRDGAMKIQVNAAMRPHLRSAVILTLGYCYHARLNRNHRWGYRKRIADIWKGMKNTGVEWLSLENEQEFASVLTNTQYEFVEQMDRGEGIALNEALRENLFMLLVSVMNQIPILLVGKPGCSKSLAMGVLQSNLNGPISNKEFFQLMPAVEVFAYQCSPLSTPDSILNAFHQARQSNLHHKSTIVCVLLDEVGLAEESPHLPLKVLHKELEDLQGISCVGISNWALDAAKMSRCVTLYRPPPTVDDLVVTAEGIVASMNLSGYLKALSEAFFEIYKTQKRPDFWGMREFYSTVRVINAELKVRSAKGLEAALEPQVLLKTVMRNFGGCSKDDLENCIEEFFDRVGMTYENLTRYSTLDLIKQNLAEMDARHLMLLTKNNAALRLLFQSGLLTHSQAEVLFGSTFPNDQSDVFVAMNLQRIKSHMQQPISLVMVHCDSLYESLYDLLNQHYMEYAGQRYVRIAHGSKAKQCPIHKQFRVIVITEISDAYFRLAPPLLNRFEKQIFLRKDLMQRQDEALLKKITKFWDGIIESTNSAGEPDTDVPIDTPVAEAPNSFSVKCKPIAGYHPELLSSLVFTLRRKEAFQKMDIDSLFLEARRRLIQVLTPESVCIVAARFEKHQMDLKFGGNLVTEYFDEQRHSDLPSYAEVLVKSQSGWCDEHGAQILVMSYSPVRGKMGSDVAKVVNATPTEVSLHELSSSTDIETLVNEFYVGSCSRSKPGENFILLIHADPSAASVRMIEHCRFVCEKTRKRELLKIKGARCHVFVMLVIHLQRGVEGKFSFDFDPQWDFVFLDSVEPSADLGNMPSLGSMLNMPLIEVVKGLDFPKLLRQCFRSALSRLIYPHIRKPGDLQSQIKQLITFLDDTEFVTMIREWMLRVLEITPKNLADPSEGSVGQDTHWFASIANAAHELALAGTFRAALHNRVVVLITSLLTTLLAHHDRNAGLVLFSDPSKRPLWVILSKVSLKSPLSGRLHTEAIAALTESASAQHEVGTDSQTSARPFVSKYPVSWLVTKSITGFRQNIEFLPQQDQLSALTSQYQLSMLREVGLDPEFSPSLMEDYIGDFTAMHLDYTARLSRLTQQRILKNMLQRIKGGKVSNVLEVHQLFWNNERRIAYCINLLNEVQRAVSDAETLIGNEKTPLENLDLDIVLLVHRTLCSEISSALDIESTDFYRDWLTRKQVVGGLTKSFLAKSASTQSAKFAEFMSNAEPRVETLAMLLQHVAHPLKLPIKMLKQFAADLPNGKIRHAKTFLAILKLAQKVSGMQKGLDYISAFIENWVLDVCLRDVDATNDLDPACLELFCSLAAGLPLQVSRGNIVAQGFDAWQDFGEVCIASCPDGGGPIPRSSCLNLALLRKLIVRSDGQARKTATAKIEALLQEVLRHQGHNDTTFATKYAVLCEEHAASRIKALKGPSEWPSMALTELYPKSGGVPAKMLQDVGAARWIFSQYANELCKDDVDMEKNNVIVSKVNALLETNDDSLAPVCRSMRLYLLKCIERQRGVSTLRGLLAAVPLRDTSWVAAWRNSHDIDFEKFIGAALVPKWNPFVSPANKAYDDAKTVVLDMMQSTSTEKLDAFARACKQHTPEQQSQDISGFLLALLQEPGLLSALEEKGREPPFRNLLNSWLAKNQDLPVTAQERMLLRIFAGDGSVIKGLNEPLQEAFQPFCVCTGCRMDDLLRWRFLGHLAAALIGAKPTSLLAMLRRLMLYPGTLQSTKDTYLPGMDEDIRNRVLKALLERGENIWKHKSHWYKCNCGYNFFIGECGRPMEVTSCPQCKLPIGGKDHNKTGNTAEDDENDRSPPGYMLPATDKDDKHVSFREIPSSSARAIRLLLHGAMFCGLVAHLPSSGTDIPRVYDKIVNKDSMCTMLQETEAKFIGSHFANDWQQMVDIASSNTEDLAATFHALLSSMSVSSHDPPKTATAGTPNWDMFDLETRNSWEETLEAKYLIKMIKEYDAKLQGLYTEWSGFVQDGKFVAELKETADVRDFPKAKRKAEMPQVWAFRSAVTLDALHARMGVEAAAMQKYPVLCLVLQQPLFSVLRALGMLVGVFEWHHLVMSQFSGRITRKQAGETTVRDVFTNLPSTDREKWSLAFKKFETAWRVAWPFVERHECTQISENLRKVMVGQDSSLLWCIADATGEGICPLALTQWLVERNNELVQVVSTAIGYPARKVSSRMLGQQDVINYDAEELIRFLHTRCVTYGDGGKLHFDLLQLENKLRREMARPEITVELRAFQWLGESFSMGNELRTVVKQRDLTPEVIERIKAELASPALANISLQKVQMSISFILKSGGGLSVEHAGEMRLSEYMRSVLQEPADSLPSMTARREVHLWHIDSFAKLLKGIINKDPMDSVDPKYKAPLPKKMEDAIVAAKSSLPPEFAEVMGSFAEKLVEAYIGENIGLMDVLPDVWEASGMDKDVLQEITPKLPKGLQMKHWAAVYNLLKQS